MFKHFLQSWLFSLTIVLVIIFFTFSIMEKIPTLIAVQKESKNLNKKIEEANKEKLKLERLGDFLGSDAYLERQARIKLNYKKPDENVVFVYKNTNNGEKLKPESDKFFSKRIKDWFIGLVKK